jgi:SOUL heme-binding protein
MGRLGLLFAISVLILEGCVSLEIPKYEILRSEDDFELRQYPPLIIAETVVESDFDEAGKIGFRRLADYIFGANIPQQKIAMTAPVEQSANGEKIAMTAPVGQSAVSAQHETETRVPGSYVISFTMPATYDLASLPKPKDPTVRLRQRQAARLAVVKFSGRWNETRYQEKLAQLEEWLKSIGLKTNGAPNFARYDPPWTLWFMRRNEILVEATE